MFDQVTPYAIALLLTAIGTFLVALYAWRHRDMVGGRIFSLLMIGIAWWSFTLCGEALAIRVADKVTFSKLEYLSVTTVPTFWFIFAFRYIRRDQWLTSRNRLLLWVIPVITILLVMTNEWHHLHWSGISTSGERLTGITKGPLVVYERGLWFWVNAVYLYILMFTSTFQLLRFALRTSHLYRHQARLLALAAIFPLSGNFLYLLGVVPVETTPFAFAATGLLMTLNLLRYQFLEIVPVARDVLVERMQNGVLVVDQHHYIVDINPAARQLLNTASTIGRPLNDVLADYPDLLTACTAEDGREHEVLIDQQHIAVHSTTLYDHRQQISGRLITLQDINLRKFAEAALETNIQNLRLLHRFDDELNRSLKIERVLEIAADVVMRLTHATDGFFVVLEQEKRIAFQGFGDYFDNENHAGIQALITAVVQAPRTQRIPNVANGSSPFAHLPDTYTQIVIPLLHQRNLVGVANIETQRDGVTDEIFEFLQLITARIAAALDNARLYALSQTQLVELGELYQQVKALEELKTQMIRVAAHDIRNPIGVILGFADMLNDNPNRTLSQQEIKYLGAIVRAAQNVQQITEDILSVQRIEQMHSGESYEALDLAQLTQALYLKHRSEAEQKQQVYQLTVPPTSLMVFGDPAQLREAIDNLIGNAIKYTPAGGSVTVTLQDENGQVCFEVRDTGYGVPEEQQARLFQPFFRAKSNETRRIEGTGLGLYLVKSIIDRHQGKMRFHSEYSKGSTFGFEMPLHTPQTVETSTHLV